MKSSYKNNIDFSDILKTITKINNPKIIVEIGILEGFSLRTFIDNSSADCKIYAYDIFEEFNGNGADYKDIFDKFKNDNNVKINRGDFYKLNNCIKNNSIDILHIDIANDGDVYEYVFENYIEKVKKGGYIILEGGSKERDNINWMKKYNKKPINETLNKYSNKLDYFIIDKFPSITIVKV